MIKKRITAIAGAAAIVLTMALPVFAQSPTGDATSRFQVLQEIFNGTYAARPGIVSINFTQAELRNTVLPLLQSAINSAMGTSTTSTASTSITLTNVTLTRGRIVLVGTVQQPVPMQVTITASPRTSGGSAVFRVTNVTTVPINLTGVPANTFTFSDSNPKTITFKLPNFRFTSLTVSGTNLRIRGDYTGATTTSTPTTPTTTTTTIPTATSTY